ncbi:MAG: hypothetical protein RIE86_09285 [Imperialibacter sp.]|uniref:hypothetical protein n=1 Tax=Imperialibacter sp. TaxID=2038411 RepID=UPI0032EB25DE
MRKLTTTEQLLLAMINMAEDTYFTAYFQIGSQWMETTGKGWNMWGDTTWEGWWHQEWERVTEAFLDKIKVDQNGTVYYLLKTVDGPAQRIISKPLLCSSYLRYIHTMMLQNVANQAVMEAALYHTIKQVTKNRKQ